MCPTASRRPGGTPCPAFKEDPMTLRSVRRAPCWAVLCGAAWWVCAATPGYGQYRLFQGGRDCPPACVPSPGGAQLGQPLPYQPAQPYPGQPPYQSQQPQQPPQEPEAPQQPQAQLPQEQSVAAGGETFAAAFANGGYIDPAIPQTQFRLRFESAYNDNR